MYSFEFKKNFLDRLIELVEENDIFEGAIHVGGIGGERAGGSKEVLSVGSIYTHVPVSTCLYRAEDMEEAEGILRSFLNEFGVNYVQRTVESPEHIKLDAFIRSGLNATLHIEVTSSLRIKSGNFVILSDKDGKIPENAVKGEAEENARYERELSGVDRANSPYFELFYQLRRCEQNLLHGDLFTAELHLSNSRLELMKLRGRIDGLNLRAAFPSYGKLSPDFLEKLKGTYPAAITEEEIVRAAENVLALYEENKGLDGNVPDESLYSLFYEEKLHTDTIGD